MQQNLTDDPQASYPLLTCTAARCTCDWHGESPRPDCPHLAPYAPPPPAPEAAPVAAAAGGQRVAAGRAHLVACGLHTPYLAAEVWGVVGALVQELHQLRQALAAREEGGEHAA